MNNHPHGVTAQIVSHVETMIAIPNALAFPDKPALSVLSHLTLKGRNSRYLSHPEFLEGFSLGYECGLEELQNYDRDAFTFGALVHETEILLSGACYRRDCRLAEHLGWRVFHRSFSVGSAFGWLAALFDNGVPLRLPRTPAELERRLVSSPITASRVSAFEEIA